MTCPHSTRGGPCSQCAAAPVRVCEIVDGRDVVAGVVQEHQSRFPAAFRKAAQRGGKVKRASGIAGLIARSSIGDSLRNIAENGIEDELAKLECELKGSGR